MQYYYYVNVTQILLAGIATLLLSNFIIGLFSSKGILFTSIIMGIISFAVLIAFYASIRSFTDIIVVLIILGGVFTTNLYYLIKMRKS